MMAERAERAETEEWVAVAPRAALGEGDMMAVTARGKEIALYCVGGAVYATDNLCTHAFANLTDGFLDGDEIECPLHAGRFKVTTGEGLGPPIPCDLQTYKVRVAGDMIEVAVAS
jgi:naphthalene 1,2-dioxygenase ferredoxin component